MTPRYVAASVAALVTVLALTAAVPVTPAAAQPPEPPAITVDPTELGSVQRVDQQVTRELTIGNAGGGTLQWEAFQFTDEPWRTPIRPATPVRTAPVPDPSGSATLETYPGHRGRPGLTVTPTEPPPPAGSLTVTHSTAPTIVASSAVACARNRGVLTTETSYLRQFTLDDFGIVDDFQVSSVAFGVESLTGSQQPITVNLYTMVDPDGLFVYENFQSIGSATVTLDRQTMTMVRVPVTGTAPAGATLVVEVAAPDMARAGFYIGANPTGESAASYLRAPACGLPEPAATAALGLPGMQILLTVSGETDQPACDVPTGTPWLAIEPAAGSVTDGTSQPVAVTFDSTGRAVGDRLAAELCLLSNDPDRALVVVPVSLEVAALPVIDVSPAALAARQVGGAVPAQQLSIGNTGDAPLEWEIESAGAAGCADPAGVPWLRVTPDAGTTPAGERTDATVSFDVTGLATGEHQAHLCVANNDPDRPVVEVPVTVDVTVTCAVTITGVHSEPLTVTSGVTCLAPGARVEGQVNVLDGAGLAANTALIQGPLATFGATTVELVNNQVVGPISIRGTHDRVTMTGTQVIGSVLVVDNRTGGTPIVVSSNWVVGSLFCTGNQPPPTDDGAPNTVIGGMKLDQCAGL
ncbi:MAG TPA: hypothetical protein VIL37_01190 [Natronosporangium sp.]